MIQIYLLGLVMVGKQNSTHYKKIKNRAKMGIGSRLGLYVNAMLYLLFWPVVLMYNILDKYLRKD